MNRVRITASIYFILQAISVGLWWLLMYVYPSTREHFRLDNNSFATLNAFWLGDLILIAPVSLVAGILLAVRHNYSTAAMWLATGGIAQATFYTFALAVQTDQGWLGVTLMLPAVLWSGLFATVMTVKEGMFRRSASVNVKYILFKTLAQIVIAWSVILVAFPYLITLLEAKLGIEPVRFMDQSPVSGFLFIAFSSIGIWSAIVMSRVGKGTPLPLDHATKMVVEGPYAYVRNPMALSGIGQGLAVALFLGSPLVAVYALIGSAIWQLVFRPFEEEDLAERFGADFAAYEKNVRCWIPRLMPYKNSAYQIEGTIDSSISSERPSGKM